MSAELKSLKNGVMRQKDGRGDGEQSGKLYERFIEKESFHSAQHRIDM